MTSPGWRLAAALCASLLAAPAAVAQTDDAKTQFPTTEFAEGANSASVSAGGVTAGVSMVRRPDLDPDEEVPLLSVFVDGQRVLEAAGVASGFDFPAAEASIAEIDPENRHPEVYFTSYSGGAHCCSTIMIAEELGGRWVVVPIGEFDGDGNYLADLNGDGVAEIATVDNRFLYQFDCYACSAAPLVITSVRGGKAFDVSTEPRFLQAHKEWLSQIEDAVDPGPRGPKPRDRAGWVATKARLGEGEAALGEVEAHWDAANDPGEEVCLTRGEPEDCARRNRAVLKFPDRLRLFLTQTGYLPR